MLLFETMFMTTSLTPPPTSVEYLVVAGGGGGGTASNRAGGGGGAGGFRTASNYSITFGEPITVTVGGGGAGSTSSSVRGSSGTNSVFGTITSVGGGGAGSQAINGGLSGGSGGGASSISTTSLGGSGTVGQGNDGGNGYVAGFVSNSGSGGGGGASQAGANGTNGTGGNGGNGTASSISGSSVTYAGGGGGSGYSATGAGGSGGGGAASSDVAAGTGTINTGSGGGGSRGVASGGYGGAGGSGVVIIRYPDTYAAATSTSGSPTVTVAGGYRVYTFTGSGSITFDYQSTPGASTYQYVKWLITGLRTSGDGVQASEFCLQNNATDIAGMNYSTVTAGSSPEGEGAQNLVDGNTGTKWYEYDGGSQTVIFNLGLGKSFNGYRWSTANDAEGRDPVSWEIYGSNDGTSYTLLHTVTSASITTNRETNAGYWTF